MKKDFSKWHTQKKHIHTDRKRVFFKEREVWFTSLGCNIGFEEDGRGNDFLRPVVVFKKFNTEVFWAIPLTKTQKEGKYYMKLSVTDDTESRAILSQLRLIDAKRLHYRLGTISKEEFKKTKKRLMELFA